MIFRLDDYDAAAADAVCVRYGIGRLAAALVSSRGCDPASLLDLPPAPSCATYPDLILAARLVRRHARGRVVVHGDYDADGVCSAAVLWHAISLATGSAPHVVIPSRLHDGYGLGPEAARRIGSLRPSLVVTTDCGISSCDEVASLRRGGADVLVVDHHPPSSSLPPATAFVHPAVGGWPEPHPCASGAAYLLAATLLEGVPHHLAAIAAVGTVADVVPLLGLNRRLVMSGLASGDLGGCPGLAAVLPSPCDSGAVAFGVAPKINAAGRLGCASLAFELFTTATPTRAAHIAAHLDRLNVLRREIDRDVRTVCHVEPGVPSAFASADFHPGVVGIVAGRLAEQTGTPAAVAHVLPDGRAVGSVRSPTTPVCEILGACADSLQRWGGHAAAGGFTTVPGGWGRFAESFRSCRTPAPSPKSVPVVRLPCLGMGEVADLSRLEPFGAGNPAPVFGSREVFLVGAPRLIGKDRSHLSMEFSHGASRFRAVGFGMAERSTQLRPGRLYDIAYEPYINEYGGRRNVELRIRDFVEHG